MSEAPTVLTWEQGLEDHLEAHLMLVRRRLWRVAPLLALLIGAVAVFVSRLAAWWAGLLVVAVSVGLIALLIQRRLYRRRLAQLGDALPTGTVRWELSARGLTLEFPARKLRVPWSSVREVVAGKRVHLVFVSQRRALFVPERVVPDPDAFFATVERLRADPEPHVALPPPADDPWTIAWDWELEDHISYVAGVLSQRPVAVRSLLLGLVLVLLALFQLLAGGALLLDEPVFLATGVVYLVLGGLIGLSGMGGRVLRHLAPLRVRWIRGFDPDSFPLHPIHMQFGLLGAYYRTAKGSGLLGWSSITAVQDAIGCVNLMVGPTIGFSVPDRAFADRAERARFVDEMDRFVATATQRTSVDGTRGSVRDAENPFAPPEGP